MTAAPKRVFDPVIPLVKRLGPCPDTEDPELTAWLGCQFDEIFSLSDDPPRCPHCDSGETVLRMRAAHPKPVLPVFRCLDCEVHFRRTTGTPLARLKFHNLDQFARLLSQQRSIADAAEIIGTSFVAMAGWVKRTRQWMLQLDPSGYWEAKVRLGMEIRPVVDCPRCGAGDTTHYYGFWKGNRSERQCRCDACGHFFRMSKVLEAQSDGFALDHRVVVRAPSPRRKISG